ncbi:heterokaryon incompatibility [Colletotrichum chrysophilum]|uniref:Heterokaryon incompatibility n=1 Tax=Colletotrichum chrysophilum TaxID=1836956 RepID=A0AAD9AEZ5_9PEZI|nr:heterokaryon incompatibility [Colletotrichum chrysophilum]
MAEAPLTTIPDVYFPLPHSDSIRILVLLPADRIDAELHGSLVSTRLSDCEDEHTSYVTLSYVWGRKTNGGTAKINGQQLPIGRNISDALRHIRRRDKPIRVWADAICIDQVNVNERNHQVQQMRDIYALSTDTIIYLGNDNGRTTTHCAWNFLERNSMWALDNHGNKDYDRPSRLQKSLTTFRGTIQDVEASVLSHKWFSRVWVLQEVVVSKLVSIQCGCRRIPWDDFCKMLLLRPSYQRQYSLTIQSREKIDIVQEMFQARCAYQVTHGLQNFRPYWYSQIANYTAPSDDITEMLMRARQLEASDPRDKVFALLGISANINLDDKKLAVDYSKHPAEVYADLARFVMTTSESFDMLSHVNHFVRFQPFFASPYGWLPSWVPDWNWSESARRIEALRRKMGVEMIKRHTRWQHSQQAKLNNFDIREVQAGTNERLCPMFPDLPLSGFIGPTFLSSLDKETEEAQARRRKITKDSMRWAGANDSRLDAIGSCLGQINFLGPWITLRDVDEASFQNIRDRLQDDLGQMRREIISRWRCFLMQKHIGKWQKAHEDPDMSEVPIDEEDWCLLNDDPDLEHDTIEGHLFDRGRKTTGGSGRTAWSSDAGSHVNFITDKSSAVERKRIGTFDNHVTRDDSCRVILPPGSCLGDLVVSFRGARVPFVIRRLGEASNYYSEKTGVSSKSPFEIRAFLRGMRFERCKLIGECLVNDFTYLTDSVEEEAVFGME